MIKQTLRVSPYPHHKNEEYMLYVFIIIIEKVIK